MWHYGISNRHRQTGIALVTALLYLLIITSLAIYAASSSILQAKINVHFIEEVQAFETAEAVLLNAEAKINVEATTGEGNIDQHSMYQFKKLETPPNYCGTFYQIEVNTKIGVAEKHLLSIFAFPGLGASPCASGEANRRVAWREVK